MLYVLRLLVTAISLAVACPTFAQLGLPTNTTPSEESAAEAESAVKDPLERSTPRGAFTGYISAIADEDYIKAAEYLDLSNLPPNQRATTGAALAQALRIMLDAGGSVEPTAVMSDEITGKGEDGLAPTMEQIGTISHAGKTLPLLLEQTQAEPFVIWRISSQTLNLLPKKIEDIELTINHLLPSVLVERNWNGVPIGHWIAMVLLALSAYLISRLATSSLLFLARKIISRKYPSYPAGLVKAFSAPTRLYGAVLLFVAAAEKLEISIVVRQYFSELVVIMASLALLLLIWQLVDVVAGVAEKKMVSRARFGALSAVLFFRRSVKFILVAIAIIATLDMAGFDVTTGLAALGIGGLAVALGAQKTVENLVGSLTLIFDQPVRVGDFCKVGDTVGTVEQIGMRSTRIRTLDRTLVVIPNGDFSAQKIENYAHRDKFLLRAVLGFRYETTPDQLQYLLREIRNIFRENPRVDPDPARVRFIGYGSSSLNVELFAYILANDYNEFLELQERINLNIADAVNASGTGFAFPSQTLYMAKDTGLSEDKSRAAEEQVKQWREQGEL
ncbi:mechanosensitive ion channel family protein [Alteromonas pelagimontana]|uniref:Mechanosensitive ion channel family protein n=1 Tax=Alteromonas pelagimontana TaxID=1858656 RepID=A0A6M4MF00_9ALTE|nr:mechanosensitive ion channel family protein [Alteromonas pelagimontana]QJR81669.1 mechanosensitive ion channel family protein [Alteromonas pelagimontana]